MVNIKDYHPVFKKILIFEVDQAYLQRLHTFVFKKTRWGVESKFFQQDYDLWTLTIFAGLFFYFLKLGDSGWFSFQVCICKKQLHFELFYSNANLIPKHLSYAAI